ncbi:tRNA (guanosine(46)-N7)-methyltransferase TrmB [bacterium LRH843]|nr:tRNA (guanosine(46)-N7)-methyltransferase TrmB [bacterium LRH843]
MRLRNKPWAKEELMQYPHIVIQNPKEQKGKWSDLFGNDHPIFVEVGTGKGQFLTKMALRHPHVNFIGIEKYESVLITALERVNQSKQTNVKFLHENVEDIINFFDHQEVDRIYINFTDPWPKKRHEKRRLTHKGFLDLYREIITEGGEIHLKTDNQSLFEFSLESFANYGMTLHQISLNLHESDYEGNEMTEYEERFSKKGMPIYRCEAKFR